MRLVLALALSAAWLCVPSSIARADFAAPAGIVAETGPITYRQSDPGGTPPAESAPTPAPGEPDNNNAPEAASPPDADSPLFASQPAPPRREPARNALGSVMLAAAVGAAAIVCGFIIWRFALHRVPRDRMIALDAARASGAPPAFALLLAALMVWLAQPMGMGTVQAVFKIAPSPDVHLRDYVRLGLGSYLGAAAGLAVALLILPKLLRTVSGPPRGRDVPITLAAFGLIVPPLFVVSAVAQWVAINAARLAGEAPPSRLVHDMLRLMVDADIVWSGWWWGAVLIVVLAAPIVEEFIFRALLQGSLLGLTKRPGAAVLITSVLFALVHVPSVEPQALATLFALSLALGVLMERTGRLWAPILVHALFNAMNVGMALALGPG